MLMRWLGGATAVLVLGLCVPARAADDAASPGGGSAWNPVNWFSSKKKDAAEDIPPVVPVPSGITGASTAHGAAAPSASGETEEDAYRRRTDVCLKLAQIASDTNNQALIQQAETLLERTEQLRLARAKSQDQHSSAANPPTSPARFGGTLGGRLGAPREDQP